jgi:quercetin dioxygenase-like cupin family protein
MAKPLLPDRGARRCVQSARMGTVPLLAAAACLSACAHSVAPPLASDRTALDHSLPASFGAHPHVVVAEVTYGPGGSSRPHRHPCPVVGYVLEGSVRMQSEGGPEQVYGVGSAFYEDPANVHLLSANASHDKPARFLAVFMCDDDRPLTVPVPAAKTRP